MGIKLGIIGSRTVDSYQFVEKMIGQIIADFGYKVDAIVSGEAPDTKKKKGADALGVLYATKHDIEYIGYPAKWDELDVPGARVKQGQYGPYNACAGFDRNADIARESTVIISFWNQKSKGTKDTMDKAKKLGKKVHNIPVTS